MVTVKVRMNLKGVNVLMRSPRIQKILNERGEQMAREAGPNFEYVEKPHRWVARGFVQPKNDAGRREEATDKRLTRAIRRGR